MQNAKKEKAKSVITGYLFMLVGCLSYALSVVLFLEPNEIVAGGVMGLATLVHLLNGKIPIGMISVAINVPIFILGIKYTGRKFIMKCLVTVAVLSVFTDLLAGLAPITDNALLAALYGGILQGIGIGLFIRYEFSSGGTELLGRVLARWIKIVNIPTAVGLCDAAIVVSGALVLRNADNILYALIVIFTSTKISEIIVTGIEKSKLCIIISDKGEEISQTPLSRSPRGITMLEGEGMYTHKNHNVLMTCVKNRQLTQLRQIVRTIDEQAFVIINDSVEVRGKGFADWDQETK